MIIRSLRGKLWLGISSLLLIILVIISIIFNLTFEGFYLKQQGLVLINENQKVAEQLSKLNSSEELINSFYNLTSEKEGYYALLDSKGQLLAVNHQPRNGMMGMMGMMGGRMMGQATVLTTKNLLAVQKGQSVVQQGEMPMFNLSALTVAIPVKSSLELKAILISSTPLSPLKGSIRSIGYYILLAGLLTILLGMVFSYFFSRYFTRPLLNMSKTAIQMANQDFTNRIEINSQDELALLGKSLNFLSQQLDSTITNLAQEKDLLDNIIQSMRDCLLTFDEKGNILIANNQAHQFLSFASDQKVLNINSIPDLENLFIKCRETQTYVIGDVNLVNYTFSTKFTPVNINTTINTDTRENRAYLCLLVDITKERKLETIRKELVGNVSHELRTPIALIRGYSEAILDKKAESPEILTMSLNYIKEEALRMEYLVRDLLDLSILENGNGSLDLEPLDINPILENAVDKLIPLAYDKNIKLEINSVSGASIINGDKQRLEQVFINLIINAINYTPDNGMINVKIRHSKENTHIEIQDNGLGIPQEEIPYIFDRFYKADKARQRKSPGAGIGLSLVKKIIELHHGKISVTSIIGEGSTFIIALPKSQIIILES